jgi:FtsZ-binding cell division protein ZapB
MINRIAELAKENAELKGKIDAYQMSENEANEIIAELKAENERLKEEIKRYKNV